MSDRDRVLRLQQLQLQGARAQADGDVVSTWSLCSCFSISNCCK